MTYRGARNAYDGAMVRVLEYREEWGRTYKVMMADGTVSMIHDSYLYAIVEGVNLPPPATILDDSGINTPKINICEMKYPMSYFLKGENHG